MCGYRLASFAGHWRLPHQTAPNRTKPHLARLPIPEPETAIGIAREDVIAIWRHARLARIACDYVALESLLAVELEPIIGAATQRNA